MDDFGERLTGVMRERKLKNPAVAASVGVHHGTVSKWRSGLQRPSDEQLQKLAAFLSVAPGWLRFGTTMPPELEDAAREASRFDYPSTERANGAPRHARNLPLSVREYLAELNVRLTKGGATEDEIDEAMDLLRSPQLFTFYKGGAPSEYNEADVLRGMKGIAEGVVIPELNERGRKIR